MWERKLEALIPCLRQRWEGKKKNTKHQQRKPGVLGPLRAAGWATKTLCRGAEGQRAQGLQVETPNLLLPWERHPHHTQGVGWISSETSLLGLVLRLSVTSSSSMPRPSLTTQYLRLEWVCSRKSPGLPFFPPDGWVVELGCIFNLSSLTPKNFKISLRNIHISSLQNTSLCFLPIFMNHLSLLLVFWILIICQL